MVESFNNVKVIILVKRNNETNKQSKKQKSDLKNRITLWLSNKCIDQQIYVNNVLHLNKCVCVCVCVW